MLPDYPQRQLIAKWTMLLSFISIICFGVPAVSAAADKNSVVSDLVLANQILDEKEVLDGYGQVSVRNPRNPNQYFLSRSMAPALVSESDIMTFDLDNNPVGNEKREPMRVLHRRRDLSCSSGCKRNRQRYSPDLTPFRVTKVPLRALNQMTAFIASGVPVFEIRDFRAACNKSMLADNHELGQALARVLEQIPRCSSAATAPLSLASAFPKLLDQRLPANQCQAADESTRTRPAHQLSGGWRGCSCGGQSL